MKFFRTFIALLFAALLIFWLWKWRSIDYGSRDKDLFAPVWENFGELFSKNETDPLVDNSEDQPEVVWVLHPDVTRWSLDIERFETIIADSVVFGEADSTLTALIYCDYSVDYCNDLFSSWNVFDYQEILNNNLAVYRKWFPKSATSDSVAAHRAYLCAEELWSTGQLLDYQKTLYATNDYSPSKLISWAKKTWIDDFEQCLLAKDVEHTVELQNQRRLAKSSFWLTALPTLIIYNNETQDYYKIPGRYELEEIAPTFEYIKLAELN